MTTLIANGTVIAFREDRHVAIPKGVVAFDGAEIIHVGESFEGRVDELIDASGKIVSPGFVNAHLHVTDTAFTRGYLDDFRSPNAASNYDGLYRILPSVRGATGAQDELAAAEAAFCELLLAGSTTIVELGFDFEMMEGGAIATTEAIADLAAQLGIRAYVGPRFRSGYWRLNQAGQVSYHLYPDRGRERFDQCVSFCKRWDGAHDGLIRTMLAPGQVDTCDAEMLEETRAVANKTGLRIQLHAGQSPTEYRTIQREHQCSTIEFMVRTGLLGPDFIIGHGMFLTEDGDVAEFPAKELAALVESRTTIVHLPWVKARQGTAMRSFGKFLRAGVRMALGTDTYPFDVIQEMRCAAVMSRVMDASPSSVSSADVFRAATIGGAEALDRSDLGRLTKGAKADVVLIEAKTPHAVPMRDPLGFIVFSATGADVNTVIVNGRTVVRERKLVHLDLSESIARLSDAARRVSCRVKL